MTKPETPINSLEDLNDSHTPMNVRFLHEKRVMFNRAADRYEKTPSEESLQFLISEARRYQEAWIDVKAN